MSSLIARGTARRGLTAAVAAAAGAALLLPLLPAAAAPAAAPAASPSSPSAATARSGLFGATDPTYDGAYRQSLAVLGLAATRTAVPGSAVRWLLRQQCADGSFTAFRADLAAPCPATNPAASQGPDTNSTALAALALRSAGRPAEARRAIRWLRAVQNTDGGWGYFRSTSSDANSTGLVLAALRGAGLRPAQVHRPGGASPLRYLQRVQVRCEGAPADRGGMAYQGPAPLVANALATAQGGFGAAAALPLVRPAALTALPALRCAGGKPLAAMSVGDAAAGWLGRRLLAEGSLPNAWGPGRDWSATGWAVLALVAAHRGPGAVTRAVKALRGAAASYVSSGGTDAPAALGLLLLVSGATGANPAGFGGVRLRARLLATLQA